MEKNKLAKKALNLALATAIAAGAVMAAVPAKKADAAKLFVDVQNPNSSHYDNIYNLVERGIIKGYEDGTFQAGESIKRGHAAKIIAGVLGLDTKNVKNPGFKDVSTKNPYYGAIAALANAGIINGFEDNTYRHNDTLTRGQMAKIIVNAFELEAGNTVNPFKDAKNSQYVQYITALFAHGVTTGKTATTFDIKSPVTRAQLATFVVRAEKVKAGGQQQKPTPSTPSTGGGSGGSSGGPNSGTTVSYGGTVDAVFGNLMKKYEDELGIKYATIGFNSAGNVITFTVGNDAADRQTTLAKVRQDLVNANLGAPTIGEITKGTNLVDLFTVLGDIDTITIGGTDYSKSTFVGSDFVPNKELIIKTVETFVEENKDDSVTIGELKDKEASTVITVNFDNHTSIDYTFKIQ